MRDLLFKNLTSADKKRKVIVSSETINRQGVSSIINRHFVCLVRELKDNRVRKPLPYLYVLKERNTREQKERFFCKIKGSIHAVYEGKLFLILFMHTLRIELKAVPEDITK